MSGHSWWTLWRTSGSSLLLWWRHSNPTSVLFLSWKRTNFILYVSKLKFYFRFVQFWKIFQVIYDCCCIKIFNQSFFLLKKRKSQGKTLNMAYFSDASKIIICILLLYECFPHFLKKKVGIKIWRTPSIASTHGKTEGSLKIKIYCNI